VKAIPLYLLCASICLAALSPEQIKQQIVLADGCELHVTTPQGNLVIRAKPDDVRSFEWAKGIRSAKMLRRRKPWYGNLGLYCPGPSGMWSLHDGVSRIDYSEYDLWFSDQAAAEKYLKEYYSSDPLWVDDSDRKVAGVWRNDGLLVWWQRQREAEYLGVTVAQIYIAGKRPDSLIGARDNDLTFQLTPNQSSEPTFSSGTPPAGQESRPR
jgi:hypothetical protein